MSLVPIHNLDYNSSLLSNTQFLRVRPIGRIVPIHVLRPAEPFCFLVGGGASEVLVPSRIVVHVELEVPTHIFAHKLTV
jgi:hypothetical protein